MNLFRLSSLHHRLILFLLLPVAVLMFTVGVFGWIFTRQLLLQQWQEAALLKLQRAAHFIDMRIAGPMEWIDLLNASGDETHRLFSPQQILSHLRQLQGVARAEITWVVPESSFMPRRGMRPMAGMEKMMPFRSGRLSRFTPPVFNAVQETKIVTVFSDLLDESGKEVGRLQVDIRFDYILRDISDLGWWQSETTFLTDSEGRILAGSVPSKRIRLGETGNPVESGILVRMGKEPFGTVLGPGHPPEQVGGFCRTTATGWVLVLLAPGREILSPIVHFRNIHFAVAAVLLLLILFIIRGQAGKMIHAIQELSDAAGRIARGEETTPIRPRTRDEVGKLTENFNTMMAGLKERDFVVQTFGRYVDHEIARQILKRPEAARLGGQKREVVILMSDIRHFTSFAETLSPETTLRILNRYFSHMIRIIDAHGGIIVDFFGDSVLVFFDPFEAPIAPLVEHAVYCALEMQQEMKLFSQELEEESLPGFAMGIGIHAGEVVVGNIGSETRAKYGIVGTAVNLTQRIQAVAGPGEVLVTDPVVRHVGRSLVLGRSFRADLKGIREPVRLYAVEACRASGSSIRPETPTP